jgi:hypothetical protein
LIWGDKKTERERERGGSWIVPFLLLFLQATDPSPAAQDDKVVERAAEKFEEGVSLLGRSKGSVAKHGFCFSVP